VKNPNSAVAGKGEDKNKKEDVVNMVETAARVKK
jgi:hypothetical protein